MSAALTTLDLTPNPQAVNQAIEWLERIAEQENWPTRLTFGLTLSVDEALTNVLEYGFKDCTNHAILPNIKLVWREQSNQIFLDIYDNGAPYDPTKNILCPPALSLEDTMIGGHGVRLMRHYLKDLLYEREGHQNHLTLVACKN